MRNLRAHPVTDDEIIACLETLATEIAAKHISGDHRPLLLLKAAARVLEHRNEHDQHAIDAFHNEGGPPMPSHD